MLLVRDRERGRERRVMPDTGAVNEILDDLDRFAAPTRTVIAWYRPARREDLVTQRPRHRLWVFVDFR